MSALGGGGRCGPEHPRPGGNRGARPGRGAGADAEPDGPGRCRAPASVSTGAPTASHTPASHRPAIAAPAKRRTIPWNPIAHAAAAAPSPLWAASAAHRRGGWQGSALCVGPRAAGDPGWWAKVRPTRRPARIGGLPCSARSCLSLPWRSHSVPPRPSPNAGRPRRRPLRRTPQRRAHWNRTGASSSANPRGRSSSVARPRSRHRRRAASTRHGPRRRPAAPAAEAEGVARARIGLKRRATAVRGGPPHRRPPPGCPPRQMLHSSSGRAALGGRPMPARQRWAGGGGGEREPGGQLARDPGPAAHDGEPGRLDRQAGVGRLDQQARGLHLRGRLVGADQRQVVPGQERRVRGCAGRIQGPPAGQAMTGSRRMSSRSPSLASSAIARPTPS